MPRKATTKPKKQSYRRACTALAKSAQPRQRDLAALLRKVVDPDDIGHSRARARHVAVVLCDRFELWPDMLDRATERELARINS